MTTPRRPQTEGPETPEALMISALIDSGEFNPEKYHLTEDHLTCWSKLWRFCVEYQQAAGVAPPESLIKTKFPEFEILRGLDPSWAAQELHKAHSSRLLRARLLEAIELVKQEEVDQAYSLLEGIQRPRTSTKPALDVWDYSNSVEEFDIAKIPVPWDSLGRATGGIGPAELWYIAGRPGTGKSFALTEFAARAMREGYRVGYVSCEMPAYQIHKRVLRSLAVAWDAKLLKALDSTDREIYKPAMDIIRERTPGSLGVIDPSHGRMTNALVRAQMEQYDLVLVDHVGLLSTNDGRKAIDDWRAMAHISNTLREDTLATNTSVVAAVQLNREAEHGTSAPKVSQLSQSDALGQDGTVVITMRKLSNSVRLWSAEKNREGAPVKWYTRFEPEKSRFDQVSADFSRELQVLDEDREAS